MEVEFAEEHLFLFRFQNSETFPQGGSACFKLRAVGTFEGAKGQMPIYPDRSVRFTLWKADMCKHERRAGSEAKPYSFEGRASVIQGKMMKDQKTYRRVERSVRRRGDISLMELDSVGVLDGGLPCKSKHAG